jgi:hypothetical protein
MAGTSLPALSTQPAGTPEQARVGLPDIRYASSRKQKAGNQHDVSGACIPCPSLQETRQRQAVSLGCPQEASQPLDPSNIPSALAVLASLYLAGFLEVLTPFYFADNPFALARLGEALQVYLEHVTIFD